MNRIHNIFTIGKTYDVYFSPMSYIDPATGIQSMQSTLSRNPCTVEPISLYSRTINGLGLLFDNPFADNVLVFCYDKNNQYLGYITKSIEDPNFSELKPNTYKVQFQITNYPITEAGGETLKDFCELHTEVEPHYKTLKKQYKKESSQVFFRESLNGTVTLFDKDYTLVTGLGLEDMALFNIYRKPSLEKVCTNIFNKTDCTINHSKKSVQLKLTPNDQYTKILDKYENTFDLVAMAPAITPIAFTKRCAMQIYIQGGETISNIYGGTYWETEVLESVDDEDDLRDKYYFTKGPHFSEINIPYECLPVPEARFDGLHFAQSDGSTWYNSGSAASDSLFAIRLVPYDPRLPDPYTPGGYEWGIFMSTGNRGRISEWPSFPLYKLEIWYVNPSTKQPTTRIAVCTNNLLFKDVDYFAIPMPDAEVTSYYMMNTYVSGPNFNLNEYLLEYNIWARLLSASETYEEGGTTHNMYHLPTDDFATEYRNLKYCIGLNLKGSTESGGTPVVSIVFSDTFSDEPTSYGVNDYGKYFRPPVPAPGANKSLIPLLRSTWTNNSLWVDLLDYPGTILGFEQWSRKFNKASKIKDSYMLADAIKTLLRKIDPTLMHEATPVYSQWLYGTAGASVGLNTHKICITQKTNILKGGDYDQAAQKGEITFKQLMEMLRDCFRCYWFIDEDKHFRIEHISYFMNGMSYSGTPPIQLALDEEVDLYNGKPADYGQSELSFEKDGLSSRYEFSWPDEATDQFGNIQVDVDSNYIQKDEKEDIAPELFSADIDLMLLVPSVFSEDGFALLMPTRENSMEIINITDYFINPKQYDAPENYYIQNWYASWGNLIKGYMLDMPATNIKADRLGWYIPTVEGIKRCMHQDISFPYLAQYEHELRPYDGLVKTSVGNGSIEELSTNIDTGLEEVTLVYTPE